MSLIMSLLWWKAEEYLTPSDFSMHMLWGDLFVPCFVSIIFCYSSSQMFKKCSSFSEFLRFLGTVRRVSSHNLHVQSDRNPFFCLFFSYLYQIAHLGDDDEEPEFSSAMPLEEGDTFFFQPRPLKNLVLVDEQENMSPIMSCQVSSSVCVQPHIPNGFDQT